MIKTEVLVGVSCYKMIMFSFELSVEAYLILFSLTVILDLLDRVRARVKKTTKSLFLGPGLAPKE